MDAEPGDEQGKRQKVRAGRKVDIRTKEVLDMAEITTQHWEMLLNQLQERSPDLQRIGRDYFKKKPVEVKNWQHRGTIRLMLGYRVSHGRRGHSLAGRSLSSWATQRTTHIKQSVPHETDPTARGCARSPWTRRSSAACPRCSPRWTRVTRSSARGRKRQGAQEGSPEPPGRLRSSHAPHNSP